MANINREITPFIDRPKQETSLSLMTMAEDFGRSFVQSAGISPIWNGLGQLLSGGQLPPISIVNEENAKNNVADSWAQKFGGAMGMAVDFFLLSKLKCGPFRQSLSPAQLAKLPLAQRCSMHFIQGAKQGALYGAVFTPSDPSNSLLYGRVANAGSQALTFGVLGSGSECLSGVKAVARVKPGTFSNAVSDMAIAGTVGLPAGALGSVADATFNGHKVTLNDVKQAAVDYGIIGFTLAGLNHGAVALKFERTINTNNAIELLAKEAETGIESVAGAARRTVDEGAPYQLADGTTVELIRNRTASKITMPDGSVFEYVDWLDHGYQLVDGLEHKATECQLNKLRDINNEASAWASEVSRLDKEKEAALLAERERPFHEQRRKMDNEFEAAGAIETHSLKSFLELLDKNHIAIETLPSFLTEENLLGRGGGNSCYRIPGLEGYVIRVHTSVVDKLNSGAGTLGELKSVEIPGLKYINVGQAIACDQLFEINKMQEGISSGDSKSDAEFVMKRKLAGDMPQSSYDEFARKLKLLNQMGYTWDPSKASNLLIDAENQTFNMIDVAWDRVVLDANQGVGDMAVVLLDTSGSVFYKVLDTVQHNYDIVEKCLRAAHRADLSLVGLGDYVKRLAGLTEEQYLSMVERIRSEQSN